MITLPHHVEFLSDAWLAEAERFLQGEVKRRSAELSGHPFTFAERFTDAPPHLKFDGDVGAWNLRWDGETLNVARGFNPDAEVTAEGDYQAALSVAQFVGVLAPGARRAMLAEAFQMYGKDALSGKGRLEAAAQGLMDALHDHMGRRVVENPDLAHRARRQGLTGKIREMEEQGYAVIENAISPGFADEVREACLRALRPSGSDTLNWMLYQGREFERIFQNPMLMTLVDASLGRGAVIGSFSAIRKPPGPGTIPLHVDYAHVPEPFPEFAMTGVGVWALEDWTVESGPTWIIPGSHRLRRGPRPGEGANGGAPIEMPKGSVVFFTHGVWHWQGDRTQAGDRVTLHAHFNRGILRSLEPKKLDVQMLHRNSPRLGEMLGEDDWFEKIDAKGRDYGRLAYMSKLHAFTERQKQKVLAGEV